MNFFSSKDINPNKFDKKNKRSLITSVIITIILIVLIFFSGVSLLYLLFPVAIMGFSIFYYRHNLKKGENIRTLYENRENGETVIHFSEEEDDEYEKRRKFRERRSKM